MNTPSILGCLTSVAQRGCCETSSKLTIFWKVELFFSCVILSLRLVTFEWAHIDFVGINISDKGCCSGFGLRVGGGGVKVDQSSLNVVSTKSHNRKGPIEGYYQRNILSLCQPWRMWHRTNTSPFLMGVVWPFLALTIYNETGKLVSLNPR